ncbi:uncharacterized protein LOC117652677 [Thrips palmi]|uniref:ATP-dependent DNA helicase n=1 Tax=Thrips palmi TaxID=161013 RepID=A0A6P9ACP3_THRPL|nr:uncharacterized protein LOC117652677 [Thrips palmi]
MELFHLRLLLLNRPGMRSFQDILTVDGEFYDSFGKVCKVLGINDTSKVDYTSAMCEVASHGASRQVRAFFATILATCFVENAEELWKKHREAMSADFRRRGCGRREALIRARREILHLVSQMTGDVSDTVMVPDVNSRFSNPVRMNFDLDVPMEILLNGIEIFEDVLEGPPNDDEFLDELETEFNDENQHESNHQVDALFSHVNSYTEEQRSVHHEVMQAVRSNRNDIPQFFSLVAPGGCGKTYVYLGLLMDCKTNHIPVVSCAMTAIAAGLLEDADTCHKTFGIPIRAKTDCSQRSFIQCDSADGIRLRDAKLIVIDEVSMMAKWQVVLIDFLLRDIMDNDVVPFGGKVVLLGGDMGQILPVLRNASSFDLIENSLPSWSHWQERRELKLTHNMRAAEDPVYADWILKVRDGSENVAGSDFIRIPESMLVMANDKGDNEDHRLCGVQTRLEFNLAKKLAQEIYGETVNQHLSDGIIVAPTNDVCDDNVCQQMLSREIPSRDYLGTTSIIHQDVGQRSEENPAEFIMAPEELNMINAPNLPPHHLSLRVGSIVMLLINLNKRLGLCNGTRFVVTKLFPNTIGVKRLRAFKGKMDEIFLPRMMMRSDDIPIAGSVQRFQLPITLAFCVTINKSQGQTFDHVGIFLRKPVFSHGQFYVAVGRAKAQKNVRICILKGSSQGPQNLRGGNGSYSDVRTKNIVFRSLL